MSSFWPETRVYASHVAALFVPGRKVRAHTVMTDEQKAVGNLAGWKDDDFDLLIAESRLAIAGQHDRIKDVRTTAQVLLPLCIALLVVFGTRLPDLVHGGDGYGRAIKLAVWFVGALLVLVAALGAGAILSVRSTFGAILPTKLSHCDPPTRPVLARAYAGQVAAGEITVGTRVTVIRDAVSILIVGATIQLGLWVVGVF